MKAVNTTRKIKVAKHKGKIYASISGKSVSFRILCASELKSTRIASYGYLVK